jgi:NACalpha-BTF3-like transcription factor
VVGAIGKVWNHASNMEDYSRMMLFLNGIRMGYSAKDASKIVNKALFDYSRGLSEIERKWIRRFIPFYSFQRFAIPFVLKQGMAKPGNVATLEKMMRTMEKLIITGEELTDAEVHTFNEKGNNFILEQPRLFTGFDGHGRGTLNVLNNLTPYDVANFLVYDSTGDVDVERSVEKSVMAAVTPFLKVPLSWVMDRDFFTGKTIEQASRLGDLEGSLGKVIPKFAKDLMGWETRQHKITGEVTTYINPFLSYYTMQFVPALRDVVNVFKDTDPLEQRGYVMGPLMAAMELMVPATKQTNVDFRKMSEFSILRKSKEIRELEREMAQAIVEGSDVTFNQRYGELLRHINILQENVKQRNGMIRGLGIAGLQGMTDETIDQSDVSPTPLQQEYK